MRKGKNFCHGFNAHWVPLPLLAFLFAALAKSNLLSPFFILVWILLQTKCLTGNQGRCFRLVSARHRKTSSCTGHFSSFQHPPWTLSKWRRIASFSDAEKNLKCKKYLKEVRHKILDFRFFQCCGSKSWVRCSFEP